ncbi:MAG TPA: hypothetical protein DCQ98_22325, partial [Planctomycetaceae bacterium]|nr:hypothetical protein [Planctomycetaceae bacterium]
MIVQLGHQSQQRLDRQMRRAMPSQSEAEVDDAALGSLQIGRQLPSGVAVEPLRSRCGIDSLDQQPQVGEQFEVATARNDQRTVGDRGGSSR